MSRLITVRATQAPTVTGQSSYASGNLVGGKLTFANMRDGGAIQTVTLRDGTGNPGTYDLFLFNADPTNTTFTDKSAVAIAAADLTKVLGVITLDDAKLGAASGMGVSTLSNINLAYVIPSGTTLYGALVTRSTPTYLSGDDISIDIVVRLD